MLNPTSLMPPAWRRVVVAAALAIAATYTLSTLAITLAITGQGFRLRGAPDPVWIEGFISGSLPWVVPLAVALSTFGSAFWAARRVDQTRLRHGVAVGALVALFGVVLDLLSRTAPLPLLVAATAACAAGWAGGRLAERGASGPAHA